MVQGVIAGGREALVRSVEWAEDRESAGAGEVEKRKVGEHDFVLGITASGQAPFVLGAMKRAKQLGASVGALSCNRDSKTFDYADHRIFIDVGPEIVSGSTRMKSGTAQKLVLNMITTASMIRMGKVYNNLMVDLKPVNNKLVRRSKRLIRIATGCTEQAAERAFEQSGRSVKTAIVMVELDVGAGQAETMLEEHGGRIGPAIDDFRKGGG
jgi:N-acetylmuramic acid 6-phosphate etherase